MTPVSNRLLVLALFVSSCLLSIVSFYTTQQGMALYLNGWFSILAAAGVQVALVMVAWLIGFTRTRRALLISVYAITAVISVAFSYVTLYTWFSVRERPAEVQRALYDTLSAAAAKAEQPLAAASAEASKHALALEELATAEQTHGFITRSDDTDPYLSAIREAVAGEGRAVREGAGAGPRYTAFDRYAKLARQSAQRIEAARQRLAGMRSQLAPTQSSEQQLRAFRESYDALPWQEAEEHLHRGAIERTAVPNYADYVDKTSGGQEDLLVAFEGLVTRPTPKHLFSLTLAAFIDIIVFLLAYASGPYFHGAPEQRWTTAAAHMEGADRQLFIRDFLRKISANAQGLARVEVSALNPGEQQFCLLLIANNQATLVDESGHSVYLIDHTVHESLLESLTNPGRAFRATSRPVAAS